MYLNPGCGKLAAEKQPPLGAAWPGAERPKPEEPVANSLAGLRMGPRAGIGREGTGDP